MHKLHFEGLAGKKISPDGLPSLPGVYLFKNSQETVLYIGKAKNIKKRVKSYFQKNKSDVKADALLKASSKVDHIVTTNEVEALLLEAQLIKNYQPQYNILLKSGQPYLYLLFKSPLKNDVPELTLVRKKDEAKGTYFGPFLEKRHARKVYNFLNDTFHLKLCKKKIENGCLYYHIGKCAGACKSTFDKKLYLRRFELARQVLKSATKSKAEIKTILSDISQQIEAENKKLNFEKSKELNAYKESLTNVFVSLQTHFLTKEKYLSHKHIWIYIEKENTLFLFQEQSGATKKREVFCTANIIEPTKYLESYYHSHDCPQTIMTNFEINNKESYELFLKKWHKKPYPVTIIYNPENKHLKSILKIATTHAEQELEKADNLGVALKKLLKLSIVPQTIDCFDVSHKQGKHMVGSCIRFTNGKPDKNNFRKFRIKTISKQDDYACLREIVSRRYKNKENIPDLVLIDGGKGQLSTITNLLPNAEVASLAKKEETIFSKHVPSGKKLSKTSLTGQLLISLRDYAHHFAISYHQKLDRFSSE